MVKKSFYGMHTLSNFAFLLTSIYLVYMKQMCKYNYLRTNEVPAGGLTYLRGKEFNPNLIDLLCPKQVLPYSMK